MLRLGILLWNIYWKSPYRLFIELIYIFLPKKEQKDVWGGNHKYLHFASPKNPTILLLTDQPTHYLEINPHLFRTQNTPELLYCKYICLGMYSTREFWLLKSKSMMKCPAAELQLVWDGLSFLFLSLYGQMVKLLKSSFSQF